MAANTAPIFPLTPNIGSVAVGGSANVRSDGNGTIGTDIFKAFTAGTDGSFLYKLRLTPVATAAATATTATVLRVFISSVASGATTQSTAFLIAEIAAPSQSAANASAAVVPLEIPLNIAIPGTYTVLVTSHAVNAASTSWEAVVFGGNY
jgi:hypothetical protein